MAVIRSTALDPSLKLTPRPTEQFGKKYYLFFQEAAYVLLSTFLGLHVEILVKSEHKIPEWGQDQCQPINDKHLSTCYTVHNNRDIRCYSFQCQCTYCTPYPPPEEKREATQRLAQCGTNSTNISHKSYASGRNITT